MYLIPQMNAYRRDFHETKKISFLIKDEKYNEIAEKVYNSIKK